MSVDIAHTTNRRRGSKVRTGCFTCKIRKVKCDETRPSCSRCTDTGRKCDGYPLPKDSSRVKVLSPSRPIRIFRPTVSGPCALGDSVRYLEFYYHCAAPLLSSRFDRQFWSKIILQLSYSEPAIRHAVVALGYLHKTEPGSIKHARSNFQVLNGSRVFLHHYNEAVRKLVDRMAEPSFVPEIGLATCLLFICIEFFRGNYGTAFTHMTNGLRLIRDWTNDSIGVTRPGTLIEHMLLPMFQRGVTSALLYGVAAEEHYDIPVPDPNTFIKLPFSLLEAEKSSRELRNASIVFVRNVSIKWHGGVAPSWQDLQTQAQLIACHQRWLARVESFSCSLPSSSTVDRVSFSALKVVQYATSVHVACATSTHQTAYDAYLPTFHALLDEAEIVLDAISASKPTSPAANFTFEISLVAPLHHTATRCRCPTTRRRAISLLERGPPREGLWDAEQHALVARRTVELEERELDSESGWPVERTRLYSSVIDANMDAAGGFWVHFLPSEWVGMLDEAGRQRQLHERFVM